MSRADRFTQTDIKKQVYSDFLTNLNKHPVSGDVVRFVNEQAVIRSVKNLLNTNRGERFFQPDLGANIRRLLFEQMGPGMESELATEIRETITKHEPRAKILELNVQGDYNNNKYVVTITILVVNKQDPVTFNVALTRVR